jgi:hypothetical protein
MSRRKILVFLIGILILLLIFFLLFFYRKPSFEEVKQKLSQTETITIRKIDNSGKFTLYKTITDEKTIKEIITILQQAELSQAEWENLVGDTYQLIGTDTKENQVFKLDLNLTVSSNLIVNSFSHRITLNTEKLVEIIEQ